MTIVIVKNKDEYRLRHQIKEVHYNKLVDILLSDVALTERELYLHFQLNQYNCLDLFDGLNYLDGAELYNNLMFTGNGNLLYPF